MVWFELDTTGFEYKFNPLDQISKQGFHKNNRAFCDECCGCMIRIIGSLKDVSSQPVKPGKCLLADFPEFLFSLGQTQGIEDDSDQVHKHSMGEIGSRASQYIADINPHTSSRRKIGSFGFARARFVISLRVAVDTKPCCKGSLG